MKVNATINSSHSVTRCLAKSRQRLPGTRPENRAPADVGSSLTSLWDCIIGYDVPLLIHVRKTKYRHPSRSAIPDKQVAPCVFFFFFFSGFYKFLHFQYILQCSLLLCKIYSPVTRLCMFSISLWILLFTQVAEVKTATTTQ